jgi:hypothetical protein
MLNLYFLFSLFQKTRKNLFFISFIMNVESSFEPHDPKVSSWSCVDTLRFFLADLLGIFALSVLS